MSFEMPLDQIKQLQISLRKEANLSWYEPEKGEQFTLPKLPSVAESIEKFDPSPPYLRCKNCKGKLLRDLQSFICVFCGTNPLKDLPPDPINFKSTVGYRWLLDSLKLDGSEMVRPFVEGNESNIRRSESKNEIPLSELLDLEIRWSSESEGLPTSNSGEPAFQSQSAVHLVGVDLDSFFAQRESTSSAFEEQLSSNKHTESASNNAFQVNQNLSLFQNTQVPETATGSTKDQGSDSSTGWEASFQSAVSSGVLHEKSKYFNPSEADLDATFGYGKDSVGVKKNDDLNPPASIESDWFQGGIWKTSKLEVSSQTGKSEVFVNFDDTKTSENVNSTSTKRFDWMQDDQWQGTSNKTTDNVATNEVDDSFDAWNDFRGSTSVQDPSNAFSNSEITDQAEKSEKIDDSFDAWNDFRGSTSVQDPSNAFSKSAITGQAEKSEKIDDSFDAWNDFRGSTSVQDPSSALSNSEITGQAEKSEKIDDSFDTWNDFRASTSVQDPSSAFSNSEITGQAEKSEKIDDSFDTWNDFRASTSVQDPSSAFSNSEITGQTEKSEKSANLNDIKRAESGNDSSAKNFNWIQDEQWQENNNMTTGTVTIVEADDSWNDFTGSASRQNPSSGVDNNSEITGQSGNSEMTTYLSDPKTVEIDNNSSTANFDWFQGKQWGWSNNRTADPANTDKISDSFDAWNGFTSLTCAQDPSSNVWKQTVNETSSSGRTSEMNLFSSSTNSRDMDFGSFSQQDLFSGPFSSPHSSTGVGVSKVEASILDRCKKRWFSLRQAADGVEILQALPTVSESEKERALGVANPDAVGKVAEDIKHGDVFGERLWPKVDEVEMLMSQMHDLSFMLENNLSVPPK